MKRGFHADRPSQLWVVDFTHVPTWSGMAFTAFLTDVYSRRIVGRRTMARMPTHLPLEALEMALWIRDRAAQDVTGLIQHFDAGAQYTAPRYAERREPCTHRSDPSHPSRGRTSTTVRSTRNTTWRWENSPSTKIRGDSTMNASAYPALRGYRYR